MREARRLEGLVVMAMKHIGGKMYWVYLLECSDKSYYAGHTDNLEIRLAQHHSKHFLNCYTATRLPVTLVYSQEFTAREEALAAERKIKGWSRKKKEALIRGDWSAGRSAPPRKYGGYGESPSRRSLRSLLRASGAEEVLDRGRIMLFN